MNDFDGIVDLLSEKYNIDKESVLFEVETVMSEYISSYYNLDIQVFFNEGKKLEIINYGDVCLGNDPREVLISKPLKHFLLSNIPKVFTLFLQYAEVRDKIVAYQDFIGSLVKGTIIKVVDSDWVIAVMDERIHKEIYCVCNKQSQVKKERVLKKLGTELFFVIKNVEYDTIDGVPAVKILLSRNSSKLAKVLLNFMLVEGGFFKKIEVVRRISGVKTVIETDANLPGKMIAKMARELGEFVEVTQKTKGRGGIFDRIGPSSLKNKSRREVYSNNFNLGG